MSPTLTIEESAGVLQAFDRAISREAHNLSLWPELTWQQLHNRLQWDDEPVRAILADERGRRRGPGALPWMETRFPFAESKALIWTLAGHAGSVFACAVSPDATFIVSVGNDWTVKIWDARTGTERATLVGHAVLDTSGILVAPHPIGLNACAISPDGSFIVSAGYRELKIWNASTGEEHATLSYDDQVRDCAISPDGSFIVSASQDWTLKIWDVATGEERTMLEGHGGAVNGCAINPDGSFIISGSKDGTLKLWDPLTGEEQATLTGHGNFHESGCAISPDGSFIVSPGEDNTVKIWDVATGEERAIMHGHTMWVQDCAVSPDGSFVVSASQDGTLKVWDPATGRQQATLRGQGGPVNGCAISPDGSFIVSAGSDGTVKVWDAEIRDEPRRPRWHPQSVRACAIGPDGSFVVSASDDGTMRTWDAATGEERAAMEAHGAPVNGCAVSPDGSFIVSASGDVMSQMMRVGQAVVSRSTPNALRIWPYFKGVPWRLSEVLDVTREDIERVYGENGFEGVKRWLVSNLPDTAPDRGRIPTNDDDDFYTLYRRAINRNNRRNRLRELGAPEIILTHENRRLDGALHALLVKAAAGDARAVMEGHSAQVNACEVSPDGSFIVSSSDDGTLKVWDAASGYERGTLRGHTGPVADCAISPDASFIVSAGGTVQLGGSLESFDVTLRVWDVATFRERATLDLDSPPMACAVSPDGSFIVSGSYDGALNIRAPVTLAQQATLRGHRGSITGCAVSPDGAFIVSASRDGTLRIWEAATGWSVASLPLPGDAYCVALDPRLPTVACGDEGGSVHVADLIGLAYSPIFVTAFSRDNGSEIRCPACLHEHRMEQQWLGEIITCPTDGCDQQLRVNKRAGRSSVA